MRKSDLRGIVSFALNPISTKKEQHILIEGAGKEPFDALRAEHKKGH
jgi:hypothetical protein